MSSVDSVHSKQEKQDIDPVSPIFVDISTIPENISKLRTAFRPREFEEVEAILLRREERFLRNIEDLKGQVQTLGVRNNDLEKKYENAASKNLEMEFEAKKWKRELEKYEEKLTRATEDLNRTQSDFRVLADREKRAEDRYAKLSDDYEKETIKNKEEMTKLKEKIAEAEDFAKMWRKKYEGCEPRVKKLEEDIALILRSDPVTAKAVEAELAAQGLDFNHISTTTFPKSTVGLGKHSSDMGEANGMHMKNQEGHESGCSKQMMGSSRTQSPEITVPLAGKHSSDMGQANGMHMKTQEGHKSGCSKQVMSSSGTQCAGTGMNDVIEIDDSDNEGPAIGTISALKTAKDDGRSCKKDSVILSNGKRPLGAILNKDLNDDGGGSSQIRKRRTNSPSPNTSESSDSSAYMDNLVYGKSKCGTFKFEADMRHAINEDNELCMNAVCALYRRESSVKHSIASRCQEFRGFSPSDSIRGHSLAKFLTNGDQQGRLQKSVKDLKQHDSKGIDECRRLASNHLRQLFQIYQKKEDPFFRPSMK